MFINETVHWIYDVTKTKFTAVRVVYRDTQQWSRFVWMMNQTSKRQNLYSSTRRTLS